MKHIILTAACLFVALVGEAQNKVQIEFGVSGVCGMCEERIEQALDVPGVIMADWNIESKRLTVAYKSKKISEDEIHQLIADVGHDTDKVKAKDEVYANIHGCCKYREGASCSGSEGHDDHDDH